MFKLMRSAFNESISPTFDRRAIAEQNHENRPANRRLCCRHGQDEKHEDLAGDIAEITRERDKVLLTDNSIRLDRHEQDDDVSCD